MSTLSNTHMHIHSYVYMYIGSYVHKCMYVSETAALWALLFVVKYELCACSNLFVVVFFSSSLHLTPLR